MEKFITNQLYQSGRPGYSSKHPSRTVVDAWIREAQAVGIKTIICLLAEDQLAYYHHLDNGLLDMYQRAGFNVLHYPITDPVGSSFMKGRQELEENREPIFQGFCNAEKPVLIHCSAGQDRSPDIARYIVSKMR